MQGSVCGEHSALQSYLSPRQGLEHSPSKIEANRGLADQPYNSAGKTPAFFSAPDSARERKPTPAIASPVRPAAAERAGEEQPLPQQKVSVGVQMPYRSPPKVDAAVMAEIYETSDVKPRAVDRTTHEDEKFWYPRGPPPGEPPSAKNRDLVSQMSAARGSRERPQRKMQLPAR